MREGMVLAGKYFIRRELGQGTFGRVFECAELKAEQKSLVAVKVIRAREKYRRDAIEEVGVLESIAEKDPDNQHHCVQLRDYGETHGHCILVFEALGPSLAD